MNRVDGRKDFEMRPCKITRNFLKNPAGSVLIEMGDTRVICAATIEEKVPGWLKDSDQGWITAEYSLLPSATGVRTRREALRGKVSGRTSEIMRLIGRSLRSVVDLSAIKERTITLDCDVIDADGGTRTASITGAFIALMDALNYLKQEGVLRKRCVNSYLAAISCGIVDGREMLDLNYEEDSQAQVDMNLIMTSRNEIVEFQSTAEGNPFNREQLNKLMDLGQKGIQELVSLQKEVLKDITGIIWPD
ncbi:MAG: ribonuclease PH [Vulcanimicrobiota bacterium]